MGLLRLLGFKPSAGRVADTIVRELERIIPFYTPQGHLSKLGGPVYSQGGCECGCAPEFQFYYDEDNLAIVPCFFALDFTEPIEQNRVTFGSAVQNRLHLDRVDLVMRGEQPPEYMAQYMRR